jgi:hypothetical protein
MTAKTNAELTRFEIMQRVFPELPPDELGLLNSLDLLVSGWVLDYIQRLEAIVSEKFAEDARIENLREGAWTDLEQEVTPRQDPGEKSES